MHKRGRTRASAQFPYPMPEPSFSLVPSTPCEKNIISSIQTYRYLAWGCGARHTNHRLASLRGMGGPDDMLACLLVLVVATLVLVEEGGGTAGAEAAAVQLPGRAQQGGGAALDPAPACLLPIFAYGLACVGEGGSDGGRVGWRIEMSTSGSSTATTKAQKQDHFLP